LVEAHQRAEERLSKLEMAVQQLIEGQKHLTEGQQRLTDTVGGLKGQVLEITYRNKVFAYFGTLLRRMKVIEPHTLEDELETALTPDEFHDVLLIDLLVTGKLRYVPESPDILLALEISSVVDRTDILRAARRASLLRKAGYPVVSVVAGEIVTQGGEAAAKEQNVMLTQDGQVTFWKESLASWEGLDWLAKGHKRRYRKERYVKLREIQQKQKRILEKIYQYWAWTLRCNAIGY